MTCRLALAAIALALATSGPAVRAQQFQADCPLPFEKIKQPHPIDDSCAPEGKTTNANSQAQNKAKNNFCAKGDPVLLTFNRFARLQRAAEKASVSFGSDQSLSEDRSALRDIYTTSEGDKIGEGSLVRFAAYVVDAHYSNVSKGETVNCKLRGNLGERSRTTFTSYWVGRVRLTCAIR